METLTEFTTMASNVTTTAAPSGEFRNWHPELEPFGEYQASLWLDKYKYYILAPISIIGNLLCLVVLGRRIGESTVYLLLANMAVWDMAVIITKTAYKIIHFNEVLIGDNGCIALGYWVDMSPCIAVWLMCAVTLDRTLLVWMQLKHKKYFGMKTTIGVLVVIYVTMIGLNSFHVWTNIMRHTPPFVYCVFRKLSKEFMDRLLWGYLSTLNFAPTVLLVILNALLVFKARQVFAAQRAEGQPANQHRRGLSDELHLTVMAIVVSVVFILLTIPACIFIAFRHSLWEYWHNKEDYLLQQQLYTATFFLYDLNHCANIFLYFVASRRFRADLARLFCCGRRNEADLWSNSNGITMDTFQSKGDM